MSHVYTVKLLLLLAKLLPLNLLRMFFIVTVYRCRSEDYRKHNSTNNIIRANDRTETISAVNPIIDIQIYLVVSTFIIYVLLAGLNKRNTGGSHLHNIVNKCLIISIHKNIAITA